MPFQKGKPRPANAGRKKGSENKITAEVKAICLAMVSKPDYLTELEVRLREGKLPPPIEKMLWEYAYGKPKETLELTGAEGGPIQVTKIERVIVDGSSD
jgi:hypothetical protein